MKVTGHRSRECSNGCDQCQGTNLAELLPQLLPRVAAIFAYGAGAPPVDRAALLRMRDYMAARGPDGEGAWISDDGRVGLAHRRLTIIDLTDAGAQPMATPDGRISITFNGEIYNYRELRRELADLKVEADAMRGLMTVQTLGFSSSP